MKSHQSYGTRTFDEGSLVDGTFSDGGVIREARGRGASINKHIRGKSKT